MPPLINMTLILNYWLIVLHLHCPRPWIRDYELITFIYAKIHGEILVGIFLKLALLTVSGVFYTGIPRDNTQTRSMAKWKSGFQFAIWPLQENACSVSVNLQQHIDINLSTYVPHFNHGQEGCDLICILTAKRICIFCAVCTVVAQQFPYFLKSKLLASVIISALLFSLGFQSIWLIPSSCKL